MFKILNWFKSLFKTKEQDSLVQFFNQSGAFHPTKNTKDDKCSKTYCGYIRIGHFTSLISSEELGLKVFLRIYRSQKKPTTYILIWSFGDKKVKDFLFNVVHNSVPFQQNEMYKAIPLLIDTINTIGVVYRAKYKTLAQIVSNAQSTKKV